MSKILDVINLDQGGKWVQQVKQCQTFWCRLRGLTFQSELPAGRGLLLVENATSRVGTAIHMLAVPMALGVAWLDEDYSVVDMRVALPWRLYIPSRPARYILEGDPTMLESLAVGDRLSLVEVDDAKISGS